MSTHFNIFKNNICAQSKNRENSFGWALKSKEKTSCSLQTLIEKKKPVLGLFVFLITLENEAHSILHVFFGFDFNRLVAIAPMANFFGISKVSRKLLRVVQLTTFDI